MPVKAIGSQTAIPSAAEHVSWSLRAVPAGEKLARKQLASSLFLILAPGCKAKAKASRLPVCEVAARASAHALLPELASIDAQKASLLLELGSN